MRKYFAYIRVSTTKQGELGSSLKEQQDAISRYAQKSGYAISEWFEEQETAAKRGRTVFRKMLSQLKAGQAHGLIMHKVDRGARNLADWAELAALMDLGIDVHFAHEGLDLNSRGGRLSADIQAVVAADFIRNLRDEVKKGIYGRLKQGIYPFGAPTGYLNNGKGQLKTVDPVQGPLVRQTFELYASGQYGLHSLRVHMNARGLRTTGSRPFTVSSLARLLANPFYYGLILVKGQSFIGGHEPLISKALFDACRAKAEGRLVSATRRWGTRPYRYRRLIRCKTCETRLIAETQRSHVYYRCHSKGCQGTIIKEEDLTRALQFPLVRLDLPPSYESELRCLFAVAEARDNRIEDTKRASLELRQANLEARRQRLADLLIDGTIDKEVYNTKKQALDADALSLAEERTSIADLATGKAKVEKFLEHLKSLLRLAESENAAEINETVKSAISNIAVSGKNIEIQWSKAFEMLIDLGGFPLCELDRNAERIWQQIVTDDQV